MGRFRLRDKRLPAGRQVKGLGKKGEEMNNVLLCFLIAVGFVGCSSTEAINSNYTKMVNQADGVDEQEAKIIAQKQIIEVQEKRHYRVSLPDLKTTPEALEYPNYWFVVFGHNWLSPISTDPTAKTYTELRETQYLVVIDKKTAEVKFSGEWHSKRAKNFDWVFDPEGYKRAHPIGLPPGESGTKAY